MHEPVKHAPHVQWLPLLLDDSCLLWRQEVDRDSSPNDRQASLSHGQINWSNKTCSHHLLHFLYENEFTFSSKQTQRAGLSMQCLLMAFPYFLMPVVLVEGKKLSHYQRFCSDFVLHIPACFSAPHGKGAPALTLN